MCMACWGNGYVDIAVIEDEDDGKDSCSLERKGAVNSSLRPDLIILPVSGDDKSIPVCACRPCVFR